jgi:hypothetical protein
MLPSGTVRAVLAERCAEANSAVVGKEFDSGIEIPARDDKIGTLIVNVPVIFGARRLTFVERGFDSVQTRF